MSKCLQALLILWLSLHCGKILAGVQWVAHASAPGPDLPAGGRSLFDQLFAGADGKYRIPFPFEELTSLLESKLDNGRSSGVRQVFIPMGRSLQRNVPAPDFFRFPRAVIALQGKPVKGEPVLEYRLFIAHQPGSETLEVISYNDDAGRFEFQVVEDYAAGRQPQVRQANRAMCLGCHQNAAPIFPMRPWSETTFNVDIAKRLAAVQPQKFESMIDTLTVDSGLIDLLAERANYLAAAQLIWRQGCAGARCRAAALRALLQYRLGGQSGFEREHVSYRQDYHAQLRQNWRRNWPDGLALANSRIVDRDPFASPVLTRIEDALSPRPAHATWYDADAVFADGIIVRLASFMTRDDIERIDTHLVATSQGLAGAIERVGGYCRLAGIAAETRLLECSGGANDGLHATVEIEFSSGGPRSLHFLSLRLPDDPGLLQPGVRSLSRFENGLRAQLWNRDAGLSMRLASGDRLAAFELHWQEPSLRGELRFEVSISREFGLIDEALALMLRRNLAGNADGLGAKPFRRLAVIAELSDALGIRGHDLHKPVAAARPLAPPVTQARRPGSVEAADGLDLLGPLCGHCHGADTRNPPGFLAGGDSGERIAQCAPRILARLMAWNEDGDEAIVAMPPPATMDAGWAKGDHYQLLVSAVAALLQQHNGPGLRAGLSARDYEHLPPCLGG